MFGFGKFKVGTVVYIERITKSRDTVSMRYLGERGRVTATHGNVVEVQLRNGVKLWLYSDELGAES